MRAERFKVTFYDDRNVWIDFYVIRTSGELSWTDKFLEELLRHFSSGALSHLFLEPVAQHALLLNHHKCLENQ